MRQGDGHAAWRGGVNNGKKEEGRQRVGQTRKKESRRRKKRAVIHSRAEARDRTEHRRQGGQERVNRKETSKAGGTRAREGNK